MFDYFGMLDPHISLKGNGYAFSDKTISDFTIYSYVFFAYVCVIIRISLNFASLSR